jgi:hypothetical protein
MKRLALAVAVVALAACKKAEQPAPPADTAPAAAPMPADTMKMDTSKAMMDTSKATKPSE